ncbi:mitochondrial dynamics protein MID51 isoform X2 [Synchiropus splendidus]|uniref:mitochondrial dynamics protein MID51 isoform X2 n=1 Tax=Synchiropus splendidus TaxID=270530 RepID=UPI00237D4B68|nr:mitochondrial dynamics protein MID51 isoform X2 [Synchiropus splendidus]
MTSTLDSGESLDPAPEKVQESEPPPPSEASAQPVLKPRSKAKSVSSSAEEASVAQNPYDRGSADGSRKSAPARPPPPASIYVSCRTRVAPDGGAEPSVQPPALGADRKRSPLPPRPARPPPPSIYYDRYASLKKPVDDGVDGSSQQQDQPGETSEKAASDNADCAAGSLADPGTPANPDTPADPDTPAVPPRLSLRNLAWAPSAVYESSPSQEHPRPPPLFTPPSPPLQTTESIYCEIEFPPYLTILPDEDQHLVPSRSPSQAEASSRAPTRQHTSKDSEEIYVMLRWLRKTSKLDHMAPSVYGLSIEEEIRAFEQRANNVKQALRLFNLLMIKRHEVLRDQISQFRSYASVLDKGQKKTNTLKVAGGTTGAVGGFMAVLGIALAPVTVGASLVATAVGAGMVAAAGGIGAHASNTTKNAVSRTAMENLVEDYRAKVVDLEHCLEFILSGMSELHRHDLARLQRAGTRTEAVRVALLSQTVLRNGMKFGGRTTAERLLQAFAQELESYFKVKDPQQLKKSRKSKFSGRVHLLAQNLQDELDYLNQIWERFSL